MSKVSPAAVAQDNRTLTWLERRNAETAHVEVLVKLKHTSYSPSAEDIAAERAQKREARKLREAETILAGIAVEAAEAADDEPGPRSGPGSGKTDLGMPDLPWDDGIDRTYRP